MQDFNEQGELVEIEEAGFGSGESKTVFARYMEDAMFLIPTPQVLQKIITGLEDLYEHDIADLDMQGDLYEYMLGKLSTAGQNGQFRTPQHIREMLVELIAPTPDDIICDPSCGTAGFLVSAAAFIRKHYEESMTQEQWDAFESSMFTGFDTDRTMLRISAMNLMLHSIGNPDIIERFRNLEKETDRERTEKSFFVPKQEIVDNDYDLSINKYKKVEYIPVEYEPTEVILQRIEDLEQEVQKELAELKKLLTIN